MNKFHSRKTTCRSLLQYYRYFAMFKIVWSNHSCSHMRRTQRASQYSCVRISFLWPPGHSRTLIRQGRQRRALPGRAFRVVNNSVPTTNNAAPHLDNPNFSNPYWLAYDRTRNGREYAERRTFVGGRPYLLSCHLTITAGIRLPYRVEPSQATTHCTRSSFRRAPRRTMHINLPTCTSCGWRN